MPAKEHPQLFLALVILACLCPFYALAQSSNVIYPFVLGATQCYSCGFGNYSNFSGAEVCILTMTQSINYSILTLFKTQTCMACSPGYYNPLNESTSCMPCANKTYAPYSGMSACLPCTTADYPGASTCPPPPAITNFFGECVSTPMLLLLLLGRIRY